MQIQYLVIGRHKAAPGRGATILYEIEGACEAKRQSRGRLHVHREIGQHLAHQRLVDELAFKDGTVLGVVDSIGEGEAHQPG